ncbi:MAG: hypothetical protein Q8O00_13765, partial [Holophaga sp.]|nr:hypothetical protein [Holophaga sp.]
QGTGFSIGGGLLVGNDSLKKATNGSTGFHLGADYTVGTQLPVRFGFTLASMPGSAVNGLKTSLTLVQAHSDMVIETPAPALKALVGLSLNSYSMSRTGVESTDALDVDHHFPVRDVSGIKLGLRLGMSYAFTKQLSAEVVFQQTELAGKDLEDPMVRRGGINPSWFELGVRWHF